MGIVSRIMGPSIDERVDEARKVGATIVDVRSPGEFEGGHIPGAINVPLGEIDRIAERVRPDDVLYLYCQSGMRSSRACKQLKSAGFANVVNIGGIGSYRGPKER